LYNSWKGIVISNGGNPNYSIDTYRMALSAIDEAIRNNVACGGRRIALLDNFCWGNPMMKKNLENLYWLAKHVMKVPKALILLTFQERIAYIMNFLMES